MNMDEISTKDRTYNFIVSFIKQNGYSPSIRDIVKGTGVGSTNTANYWKKKLRDDGLIDYNPNISRSIVVTNATTN